MIPTEIGSLLKSARNDRKLSQEQAAEALSVSRQTVSNWETGKSYPDILSVLKMSELYSVSLDALLKEEPSVDPHYRQYLAESTDAVKSDERKSRLILVCAVFGAWLLCFLGFFLLKDRPGAAWFSSTVSWAILPAVFFAASALIGRRGWFGKLMWLAPPLCALLCAASGSITALSGEGALYQAVTWPDLRKLPVGLVLSLVGLLLGRRAAKRAKG